VIALVLAAALAAAPAPQVGATVSIERPTQGPVVGILGDVVVTSEVAGDVVSVGGDVELAPGAVVHGDVVAIGGSAFGPGRATGRVVGLGGLGLGARDHVSRPAGSVAWGLGLLRVGLWVVLGSLLLLLAPRTVRETGEQVVGRLWQTPVTGVLCLLVWLVAVVLALAVTATPLGAGFLLLAVGLLLFAKFLGVVGVAWLFGRAALRALPSAWRGELPRTGIALLALTALSAMPGVGAALWLVLNVVGIGAAAGALLRHLPMTLTFPRLAAR
jgi:hypothetical protein